MRHVGGFVLGLIAVPVVLYGTGWGYARTARALGAAAPGSARELAGYAALAGVGLLLGLFLATRMSPLASFLPAAALLAWTIALLWNARQATGWAPAGTVGSGMSALLTSGIYGLLGLALLPPLLIPRRWRRRDEAPEESPIFS